MSFNLDIYQSAWKSIKQIKALNFQSNLTNPVYLSVFNVIPSTNTQLWQLIDSGIKLPTAALSLQQSAGRGQWGHHWISAEGGLYLSVGLELNLELDKYPHLVMATAWGISSILRNYQLPVTIKWSNDLILEQRKLGGIKIETRNKHNKLTKAVIGVGINWRNIVPNPGINLESYYQARDLEQISSLEELTAIVAYGILLGYEYYLAVGIEKLLTKYQEILNSLGKQINFNGSSGEVIGVTTEGKLRVKLRSPGANTTILLSPGQISLGYQ